jgi:hypothetical protein
MKAVDIALPPPAVQAAEAMVHGGNDAPSAQNAPRYPYGTELHLDHDTLGKVEAANGALPDVGSDISMLAHGTVTHKGEEQMQDGSTRKHARIQIKALGHDGGEPDGDEAADKMYPTAKKG